MRGAMRSATASVLLLIAAMFLTFVSEPVQAAKVVSVVKRKAASQNPSIPPSGPIVVTVEGTDDDGGGVDLFTVEIQNSSGIPVSGTTASGQVTIGQSTSVSVTDPCFEGTCFLVVLDNRPGQPNVVIYRDSLAFASQVVSVIIQAGTAVVGQALPVRGTVRTRVVGTDSPPTLTSVVGSGPGIASSTLIPDPFGFAGGCGESCFEWIAGFTGNVVLGAGAAQSQKLIVTANVFLPGFDNPTSGTASIPLEFGTPVCTVAPASSTVLGGQPLTLTATCNNQTQIYVWSGPGLPNGATTTTPTLPVTPPAAVGTYTYQVYGRNASGDGSPASATVNVVSAPTGCTASGSPTSLPSTGGAVSLSANCTAPAVPINFTWTRNGAAFSSQQNPTDQLPPNLTTTAQTYSYQATACLAALPQQCTTVTPAIVVTVAPTLPPAGCTVAPATLTLPATGGNVALTSSCTSPASGITYNWTKNGSAFSTLQNPTDTLAPNTAAAAQTFTYTMTACVTAVPTTCAAPQSSVVTVQGAVPTGVTVISGTPQQGNAGQPLGAPLVVALTDARGGPVTGAAAQLQATSTVAADVIAAPTEVAGQPGRYAFAVTLAANPAARAIRVCLANAPNQCATFAISTAQQAQANAKSLIGPQASAAITTPLQQLSNIQQRLEFLRLLRNPTVTQGLKVSVDGQVLPPLSALPPLGDKPQKGGGASADTFERWGVFVTGDIDIGKVEGTSSQPGFDIHTKGLTLGADYRFANNNIVGAALGLTKATTDLSGEGGNQDTKGWSLSLFGEWVPAPNAYVDLALNWGRNKYDSTRHANDPTQPGTTLDFNSSPSGDQFGVSLSAGYQFYRDALTLTPYGRLDYVDAGIDAFTESGGVGALSVSSQRYRNTVLTAGGMAQYAMGVTWGVLVPYARIEYQYAAQTSARELTTSVVGIANSGQPLLGPDNDRSFGNFSLGASLVLPRGFSGYFNYQYLFGNQNISDSRYTLGLRYQF